MVLRIKGRPEPGATVTPPVPGGSMKLGKFEIREALDLAEEAGKSKFIIHRTKDLWYRVLSCDTMTGVLKLRTVHGTTFPSKLDASTPKKYVLVVQQGEAAVPPPEAIEIVRRLIAKS